MTYGLTVLAKTMAVCDERPSEATGLLLSRAFYSGEEKRSRGAQEEQLFIIRPGAQDRKYYPSQAKELNHHLA